MLTRIITLCLLCVPFVLFSPAQAQEGMHTVVMTTALGEIEVVLDAGRTPVTVSNFLRYMDAGQYNGGRFHRTVTMQNQPNNDVKIEVIQGAVNPKFRDNSDPSKIGYGSIPLERTRDTGLKHKDGTISMARGGPDTATSGFFFCIGDQAVSPPRVMISAPGFDRLLIQMIIWNPQK